MHSFFSILKEAVASDEQKVLALIVHVEGSAYLKEGSCMLFGPGGIRKGMISAGCLEEDLAYHAEDLLASGCSGKTLIYSLESEDDSGWGRGSGCSGTLFIFLQAIDRMLQNEFKILDKSLYNGNSIYWTIYFSPHFDYMGHDFQESEKQVSLPSGLMNRTSDSEHLIIYQQLLTPQQRVILFGGGKDAEPLCRLASQCGFSVIVCDNREDRLQGLHFPEADQLILGSPESCMKRIHLKDDDLVVIMTHQFQTDKDILDQLQKTGSHLKYIGILGSRKRTEKLLQDHHFENIYSPIGINIGAKGPEQIAVAIMAEIISIVHS
ncbi:XdhC family protein [Falsibacillus pallidus]|uniref:Molybdenum cofactor sulfurylase n=1 Tax=Falsibacillus pallidus TaxID=493781 RepID=A0A370GQE4_9BACI|nr:XdhC/CoxI family protein [Falsibacillus pallidus]RDI45932.1 molybdenum cofactor sulfurylase [Falsibacillus pallidus]